MSTFTTPLNVEVVKGKRKFKLISAFEYHIGEYPSISNGNIIKVPANFKTDFASIPKIFWPILSPIEEYGKAAVLHDWLYFTGRFSRKKSDDIFDQAMGVSNTPRWKREVVYFFVRIFGWLRWYKARKENDK